jgi:hypothetical protein
MEYLINDHQEKKNNQSDDKDINDHTSGFFGSGFIS